MLTKLNYLIHTDAIKEYLIIVNLKPEQLNYVYASEADMLNVALFGMKLRNGVKIILKKQVIFEIMLLQSN